MSKTKEDIELKVESPVPGPDGSWFALHIPRDIDPEDSFESLKAHIEFRRKCMNQGFDNLIELMTMTFENLKKDAIAKSEAAK